MLSDASKSRQPRHGDPRTRARAIVEFWHNRRYLPSPSSLHVHPMDLGKLEELIAAALDEQSTV